MQKKAWIFLATLAAGIFLLIPIAQGEEASSLQQQLQKIQQQAAVNAASTNKISTRASNPLGVTVPTNTDSPVIVNGGKTPLQLAQVTQSQSNALLNQPNTASNAILPEPNYPAPVQTATSTTDNGVYPPSAPQNLSSAQPVAPPVVSRPSSGSLALTPGPTTMEENVRDEAFARMAASNLPLSPTQIQLLRSLYDATQRAAAIAPGIPPRPTVAAIAVNLSPGATPPVVRLNAGMVTSLVFVDSTGAPWPIQSFSLGNPSAYNVQWDKRSNILLVQAITAYKTGNLAVILRGLNTPVMVDFIPGQTAVDSRVDLRIPGLGPQASPTYSGLPSTEDPNLLNLLQGIPPAGAKVLATTGCENCAWLLNGKLYLRTQFTILSPGWISTMMSADGTHVYVMQPTPMVLATYNGKQVPISIEGY